VFVSKQLTVSNLSNEYFPLSGHCLRSLHQCGYLEKNEKKYLKVRGEKGRKQQSIRRKRSWNTIGKWKKISRTVRNRIKKREWKWERFDCSKIEKKWWY